MTSSYMASVIKKNFFYMYYHFVKYAPTALFKFLDDFYFYHKHNNNNTEKLVIRSFVSPLVYSTTLVKCIEFKKFTDFSTNTILNCS